MSSPYFAMLVNHLWQSTLFVAAIWGLAWLLRRNSARVRYSLWLAASLKFLLPFAVVAAIGTLVPWHTRAAEQGALTPRVLAVAADFAAPMAGDIANPKFTDGRDGSLVVADAEADADEEQSGNPGFALIAILVWALGAIFVAGIWMMRWREVRRALRESTVMTGIDFPAPVRSTAKQFEPGMVGIFRPVLLLPRGIEERLTVQQMRAVLAHEDCHLRWHDNLTSALHMVVEVLFWFFPPVWWIGARLIEERERACDEQVVRDGHAPESYAEGILAVCEHYIASRLRCVSGVSGADLRKRIESILKNVLSLQLGRPRKILLAALACCAVAAPIAAGAISGSTWQALFSYNGRTAAMLEYLRLWNVSAPVVIAALDGRDSYAPPCSAVTDDGDVRRRQKVLAAMAAKMGPADEQALLYAVAANSSADVQRLLAAGAERKADYFFEKYSLIEDGATLMHIAAIFGDEHLLDVLVEAGFDVNAQGASGATPMMHAILFGQRGNAEWFMRHRADVNANTLTSQGTIAHAMHCRDKEMVGKLLRAGALPNDVEFRIALRKGFDLRGEQPWLAPSRPHAEVKADLDGDGTMDRALLLTAADGRREGLFVQLSSQGPDRWIHATEANARNAAIAPMQIATAMPGTYDKDDKACTGDRRCFPVWESSVLKLTRPGIWFVPSVGAKSVVYWDDKELRFERIWIRESSAATALLPPSSKAPVPTPVAVTRRFPARRGLQLAQAGTIFTNNDLNDDGIVTKAEAKAANKSLFKLWDRYDRNKDQIVTIAEVNNANGVTGDSVDSANPAGLGTAIISNNDLNRDGIITKAEATTANRSVLKLWDRFDRNKDGILDAAEIARASGL